MKRLWEPMLATVVLMQTILPARAEKLVPASLQSISPVGVVRGGKVTLTLLGVGLGDTIAVFFDDPSIRGSILQDAKRSDQLKVEADIPSTLRTGIHRIFLQTPRGTTGSLTFAVGDWQELAKQADNHAIERAQKITLPCTVIGGLKEPGQADYYSFDAKTGQEIVFQVIASQIRSEMNSRLVLFDQKGNVLAHDEDVQTMNSIANPRDAVLGYRIQKDGSYTIRISDFENQAGPNINYRLNVGEFPFVTGVYPIGLTRGTERDLEISGFNLPMTRIHVTSSDTPVPGRTKSGWLETMSLPVESLVPVRVALGLEPEVEKTAGNSQVSQAQRVNIPVTINGRIAGAPPSPPLYDYYVFHAVKGTPLVLEVVARRLGSPLDSVIEVLDAKGNPIERATLRPVAETLLTLSDRDSASSGFRLLSWSAMAMNDYVYCNGEVLQVVGLPQGPDDDVRFRSVRGQRKTFLDTTPTSHAVNTSVYKVQIHPPGTAFPPNGMPVFSVPYRNDDGGNLYGKDSRMTFLPPADGDYIVRIGDAMSRGGSLYTYRLTIRDARPDFRVAMNPAHPNIPRGGSAIIDVTADRLDEFDGDIRIRFDDLPKDLHAMPGVIAAGETSCSIVMYADVDAQQPSAPIAFSALAIATIGSDNITHTIQPVDGLRLVTILPEPDLQTTTDRGEVSIEPGRQTVLTAKIDRQRGFAERVPIDVRNLPYGVRVLDVGLNGVLVTEQQTSRPFVIYCEPWVKPMSWTFYVGGQVEGGLATFAPPVTLNVKSQ